jgi:Na+-driven multidrug efflux pump
MAVALFHLTAVRRERSALLCAAGGVLINVTLDLLLIPGYGAVGAAWATLAAEAATATSLLALAGLTLMTATRASEEPSAALLPKSP